MSYSVCVGDAESVLRDVPDDHFDGMLTDPPYGIEFQKAGWDSGVPPVSMWREALRTLKSGAFAFVACGTRTQHRMVVNLEDAGFEVRDVLVWAHASGFAKGRDVPRAVDKELGVTPKVVGVKVGRSGKAKSGEGVYIAPRGGEGFGWPGEYAVTEPVSDEARAWVGYDTVLKPSVEFWTLVRKPLSERTVAKHILAHGVGALRVKDGSGGRWAANLVHDGSDVVRDAFPVNERGSTADLFFTPKVRGEERTEHPTQKPVALTRHLAGLLLPPGPGRRLLVPFSGVGSEMVGALQAGWHDVVGIELSARFAEIAEGRLADAEKSSGDRLLALGEELPACAG